MHHPSQDSTYHSLCYTSHGALAGTRNSSISPPRGIDTTIYRTISRHSITNPVYLFHFSAQIGSKLSTSCSKILKCSRIKVTCKPFCLLVITSIYSKLPIFWIYFIYGYMASDIWLRTIPIVRKETRCRHTGYSFPINSKGSFICTIPQTG